MGVRNFLIDGGSGTGKTAVCDELQRRGYHAIHGDRELAYDGDPETGRPTSGSIFVPRIWDLAEVRALTANQDAAVTFFCGGSGNSSKFIDLFDGVFILEVDDLDTLMRRIDERVLADPSDWGGRQEEREIIMRLHQTKENLPEGCAIDATAPLERVVDEILRRVHASTGSR